METATAFQTAATTLQATGVAATTNIVSVAITAQSSPKTRLLIKWTDGHFQVDDVAAQAVYGVQEEHFMVDAQTREEAIRQAQTILDHIKEPRDAIVVSLAPIAEIDKPYLGYRVGDKIACPTRSGTSAERLLSISVSHTELGHAVIGLELQTRIMVLERENVALLKALGRGFTGSLKIRETADSFGGANSRRAYLGLPPP